MLTLLEIEKQYPESLRPFRRALLREYLQYKILAIIYASPYAAKLVFLGGTALRIVHHNQRFSEDLDFDNVGLTSAEFALLAENIQSNLTQEGIAVQVDITKKHAMRCRVRIPDILFGVGASPHHDEKLMIQIDTLAQHYKCIPERVLLNKFDVFTEIFVAAPALILSQKIAAVFGRKRAKGRDFFDIVFLLSLVKPDYRYLQEKFSIGGGEELRTRLQEAITELDFRVLARDVQPFLFHAADRVKIDRFPEFIAQTALEE
jgi:predicted nucleotidyltransferase component of viral defense system